MTLTSQTRQHAATRAAGRLLALAIAVVSSACGRPSERPVAAPGDAATPTAVTTVAVTLTDIPESFEAGGTVQARATATIAARIVAAVREVRVVPGDRVRTGQTLVVLDGRDLGAQVRGARAAREAAEQGVVAAAAERRAADAALSLARASHARVASLESRRSATRQELDDAGAALQAAEARVAAATARAEQAVQGRDGAQAATDAAATMDSFATLTAPFDGLVTARLAEPGDMAVPGVALLRLEDTSAFRLEARVDASRMSLVARGARVPVSLEAGADGAPAALDGTVVEVGPAVDAASRSFLVKIALPGAKTLRSGTFGRAMFHSSTRRGLAVPAGAVVRRGQVTSVFVVEGGVARVRLVRLAGTEVLAGVSESERVVTDPPAGLVDGRPVSERRR